MTTEATKTARSQAGPAPAAWTCLLYHRWKVWSYVHLSIWFADHILPGIARLATHIGAVAFKSSINFATFVTAFVGGEALNKSRTVVSGSYDREGVRHTDSVVG